jgi:sortase A
LLNRAFSFRFARCAEIACWSAGLALSGAFLAHSVAGEMHRTQGIAEAEAAWASVAPAGSASQGQEAEGQGLLPLLADSPERPDHSLWSPSRIAAWQASGAQPVLAVLEMPAIDLEAPVFQGDMERGPAWIAGTARPGEPGNAGISGHRDGYFRLLKDSAVGDALELRTARGRQRYVVEDIRIVDPLDVEVLAPLR